MPRTKSAGAMEERPPPRAEVEAPITLTRGSNACRTSQQRASSASYFAGETGRQKNAPFGSFQTITSFTVGNVRSTSRAKLQNPSRAAGGGGAAPRPPRPERTGGRAQ